MRFHVNGFIKYALLSILFNFFSANAFNNFNNTNLSIDSNKLECSRRCDTKYSDGKCWQKTFDFFTNDFISNTLNFLKTSRSLRNNKDGLNIYLKLDSLQNDILFEKFVKPYVISDIIEFSDTMRVIYSMMINDYEEHLKKEYTKDDKMKYKDDSLRCPQSEYFQADNTRMERNKFQESKLQVLKVLTVFFASATFLLIGVYVFLYLLIEMRLVNTYKNL